MPKPQKLPGSGIKDQYIAAKERWARKMAGNAQASTRSVDRLPPGQRQVHNFPVLDLGIQPDVPLDTWELKIHGKVENPITLNWQQFMALPQFKDVSDFHCVTTWSQFDMEFQGVAFLTLAEVVKPKPQASHVFFKSYDGYSTNNPLDVCMDDDVMVAHSWNGNCSVSSMVGRHASSSPSAMPGREPSSSTRSFSWIATSLASGNCAVTRTLPIRGRKTAFRNQPLFHGESSDLAEPVVPGSR